MTNKTAGIYIHIPFCLNRCGYCDFYTEDYQKEVVGLYIDVLSKEIHQRSDQKLNVDTLYFGGGNPAVLNPNHIDHIIRTVKSSFHIAPDAEITMEGNPETLKTHKIIGFKQAGINRLSIGIQSFQPETLSVLRRKSSSHTDKILISAGQIMDRVSIDMIFNVPDIYGNVLKRDLREIPKEVKHISYYSLSIEPNTLLMEQKETSKLTELPQEEYEHQQILINQEIQRRGLARYELSNYAVKGQECRHNIHYWRYHDYLGFGAGGVSTVGGVRTENTTNMKQYLRSHHIADRYKLTFNEKVKEYVMMNMRMIPGVNFIEAKEKFDINLLNVLEKSIVQNQNFLNVDDTSITLNNQGMCIYNSLLSEFFNSLDVCQ